MMTSEMTVCYCELAVRNSVRQLRINDKKIEITSLCWKYVTGYRSTNSIIQNVAAQAEMPK